MRKFVAALLAAAASATPDEATCFDDTQLPAHTAVDCCAFWELGFSDPDTGEFVFEPMRVPIATCEKYFEFAQQM